jgi:hypothetical protein
MNCKDFPFFRVLFVTRSLAIVLRWNPLNISPLNSLRKSALRSVVVKVEPDLVALSAPGAVSEVSSDEF